MYSQCPECFARFRVSAAALRAAGGTVRCGRCGSAFNALAWLSDTMPPSLGDGRGSRPASEFMEDEMPAADVAVTEFRFTSDDIEKVFAGAEGWTDRRPGEAPDDDASEPPGFGAEPPIVVVSEDRPFEDITLEGERISIESILAGSEIEGSTDQDSADEDSTDEFKVLRDVPDSAYPEDEDDRAVLGTEAGHEATPAEVEAALAALAAPEPDVKTALDILFDRKPPPAPSLEPEPTATPQFAGAGATTPAESEPLDMRRWRRSTDGPAPDFDPAPPQARAGRNTLAWSLACLVLALALLAQLVHQFRQDLVRHPQLGPVLTDVYARLGVPLAPDWNLSAFELRQWGTPAGPDAGGRLAVRASIRNRAAFAQPHPILRLQLDDRYGDAVAVRDFEPAEYLRNPADAPRLLAPGTSAEAELVVIEPGPDAVGYQLDVCVRESAELLRCAQNPG